MKEILQENGLTEQEATLYLTLLSYGQLSAYDLAEKAGLYRQYTYDALKRLQDKGMVNFVKSGKTKQYTATDPELVLTLIEAKTQSYKDILPTLNSLKASSQSQTQVETYQGTQVLSIALKDIIKELKRSGGENLCTAVDEHMAKEQNKTVVEQFERDMLKGGFKERVLIKKGKKGILQKGSSTYRELPDEFFNPNPTQIYGDCVSIFTWGNPNTVVIIRNKETAKSYRKQFELMWTAAEMLKNRK